MMFVWAYYCIGIISISNNYISPVVASSSGSDSPFMVMSEITLSDSNVVTDNAHSIQSSDVIGDDKQSENSHDVDDSNNANTEESISSTGNIDTDGNVSEQILSSSGVTTGGSSSGSDTDGEDEDKLESIDNNHQEVNNDNTGFDQQQLSKEAESIPPPPSNNIETDTDLTSTAAPTSSSQPLRTLKRLQAMLDDSDYASHTVATSDEAEAATTTTVIASSNINANDQNIIENVSASSQSSNDNNIDLPPSPPIIRSAVTTSRPHNTNNQQQQQQQQATPEKLWTSKDRAKYRRTRRTEKQRRQQREYEEQHARKIRDIQRQRIIREERERKELEQLRLKQEAQRQQQFLHYNEESTDFTDDDTDTDGGGFELPNLPVHLSDGEVTDDFSEETDDHPPSPKRYHHRGTQSSPSNYNDHSQRGAIPYNGMPPLIPQNPPIHHNARQNNVPYQNPQQQSYQNYQQQYPPYNQQQQPQQQQAVPQYQYNGQNPNNQPMQQQQENQQRQYEQQYAAWAQAAQNGYYYPPPPQLPPTVSSFQRAQRSQQQQQPNYMHPFANQQQNNQEIEYPAQQQQSYSAPQQQHPFPPQPAFVPRKPQGDFPARDDLGYEQHMQQHGKDSVQSNMAEVAPNKPENEMTTQSETSSLNGQMRVQSALVTQPNQMTSQLVPSSSTSSAIEGPINAEGPYSVFVDESDVLIEGAGSRIIFDSFQKLTFAGIGVALLSYCAVSPRSLPFPEYNRLFLQNLSIVWLAAIAPVVSLLAVYDGKYNNINTVIGTFHVSFTLGYILAFVSEVIVTTIVRLGVFKIWEPSIFKLTPEVPSLILPWVLREKQYKPKRITLFAADFGASCIASPIIEEYLKLMVVQWTCRLPRNFKHNKKLYQKGKRRKKQNTLQPVRATDAPQVSNINCYVTQMLAASLGLKLFDITRRILMYTKETDDYKHIYAIIRGTFPIHELCGTMTILLLARRDVLGVNLPMWKILGPAVFIHAMANFRGMKPIFKWNSSTPWSEMQINQLKKGDDYIWKQILPKTYAKLVWMTILCRVLGFCIKNYYLIGRQAMKRTTTYSGKLHAFTAKLETDKLLKKRKKDNNKK